MPQSGRRGMHFLCRLVQSLAQRRRAFSDLLGLMSFPGGGPSVRRLRERGGPTSSMSEAPCIRRQRPPEGRLGVAVLPGVRGSECPADSVNFIPSLSLPKDLSIRYFPPKPQIERAMLLFSRSSEGVPLDRGNIRAPASEGHSGGPQYSYLHYCDSCGPGPPLAVTGAATEAVQGPEAGWPTLSVSCSSESSRSQSYFPFSCSLFLLPPSVISALLVRVGPLA